MYYYTVSALLVIGYAVYYWMKKKYSYWSDKDVVGPAPFPFIGNFGDAFRQKKSPDILIKDIYNEFSNEDKYIGIYQGLTPALVIKDPELIKQVMIKDFSQFQDRGIGITDEETEKNLFVVEGDTWKVLRHRLSPIFTTGKLKTMIPLITKSLDQFISYTDKMVEKNVDHEIRSLASKYTLDVIGSCAFGVDMDAFSENENIYRTVADKIFQTDLKTRIFQVIHSLWPGSVKKLGIKLGNELFVFFNNMVKQILQEREGKPKTRRDLMDFMIELKEEGRVTKKTDDNLAELEMTDVLITAQALVFYAGGFETSSATMSFLLHEISQNQGIQDRLYNEISTTIKKHGGVTYDAINEMQYLEMVFDETLRKYPVLGILMRQCGNDYTFADTKLSLDKGTLILIPVYAIQNDPKYYPNPERFDPERFSPENKGQLRSCTYLPFGDGPRNCIGMRFAKVQSMVGLAGFLNKFKVEASGKTKKQLNFDPKAFTLTSKDGIWVKISRR